jgi:Raf kinase inhibitor-like YbhB/YbcL family protein
MPTPLDGDIEQQGDLELISSDFDNGDQFPNWTGYANENENPQLQISGVPSDTESLTLVLDDPNAESAVGHVFDHWLVWDIDPNQNEIPRDWDAESDGATVGYNDYVEANWGGPAPPEGSHTYKLKLLALADEVSAPAEIRKSRLGSMIYSQTEILAATQIEATYNAKQGTIF